MQVGRSRREIEAALRALYCEKWQSYVWWDATVLDMFFASARIVPLLSSRRLLEILEGQTWSTGSEDAAKRGGGGPATMEELLEEVAREAELMWEKEGMEPEPEMESEVRGVRLERKESGRKKRVEGKSERRWRRAIDKWREK